MMYTGLIGRDLLLKVYLISGIGQVVCHREAAAFLLSLQCRQVAFGCVSSAEIPHKRMKNVGEKKLYCLRK